MGKTKMQTYSVGALIKVWAQIDIEASSLADAVERSKQLGVTDFITVDGEYNDGNMKIIQVCDNDFNTEV